MRVQHNISAINANRNLTGNNNSVSKSLEKLSSGYRINRAGDDAAGLAISEKMRAQIKCLDQAETNCNDGISLIQTAEGALTEVHSMLNRMVELAEQSANGTYSDDIDRENLQKEVEQLQSEIDRIADSTNFNGKKLLNGALSELELDTSVSVAGSLGSSFAVSISGGNLAKRNGAITFNMTTGGTDNTFEGSSITMKEKVGTAAPAAVSGVTFELSSYAKVDGKYTATYTARISDQATKENASKYAGMSVTVTAASVTKNAADKALAGIKEGTEGAGLTLQIGEDSETYNKLTVNVGDMHSGSLGVGNNVVKVGTQTDAASSLKLIKDAINQVSTARAALGANQNRLEHTVNNLSVANENMTNAESRIRDTDMAKEMMTYTSKNILSQAAQSMLAQANQQPQAVLSLLQ